MVDVGLSGISLFAVLMAIFLGITLLHKEIEKRTLYTILARPISRSAYLVGKFLGLVATMTAQIALMSIIWMAVLMIQGGTPTSGMLIALLLIVCETVIITAMALFFTSFSSPFLSGLFCLGLFIAGRNAGFIEELAQRDSMASMAPIFNGIGAALPNFYLFYPSGKMVEGTWATVHGQFISSGYFFSALGYAFLYTAFFLVASTILLNRRDFI